MKYFVDPAPCSGHGQCYLLAPDVYTAGDDGCNSELGVMVDVPPLWEEQARPGAQACPDASIRLIG